MDQPCEVSSYSLVADIVEEWVNILNKCSKLSEQSNILHGLKLEKNVYKIKLFASFIIRMYLYGEGDPHGLRKTCHNVIEFLSKKRVEETLQEVRTFLCFSVFVIIIDDYVNLSVYIYIYIYIIDGVRNFSFYFGNR